MRGRRITEKKATYTQMTYYQRAKLKELLDEGLSKECIAEKLKVSREQFLMN